MSPIPHLSFFFFCLSTVNIAVSPALRLPASLGIVLSGSPSKSVPIPDEPAEVQIPHACVSWSRVRCVCGPSPSFAACLSIYTGVDY